MNDYQTIETLLEKYWEGETSLEEERQIKGYFASGAVDQRLLQYTSLFQAIREEQVVQMHRTKVVPIRPQMYWAAAASVAMLLAVGLWWLFSKPETNTIIANKPVLQPEKIEKLVIIPEKPLVAQIQPAHPGQTKYPARKVSKMVPVVTINAEEAAAMEEIKAALALVSSKIRKGRQEAAKGAFHLETVDKIFKKKEG